jgi:hypothetical protein
MGLEGVEFIMALEEAFGMAIPDADAQHLETPGHVVRYLEAKLQLGSGACLEQRAFYALRRAAISVLNVPRATFRPETRWDTILGSRRRRRTWAILHHATGVVPWPRMRLWGSLPRGFASVGDTARYLASYAAPSLQVQGDGWSRSQIEATVTRVMVDKLGIEAFDWDQRFADDLGVQ